MPFAFRSFSFAIYVAVVEVSFLVFGSGLFALRSVLKKWEDAVDQKRWDCFFLVFPLFEDSLFREDVREPMLGSSREVKKFCL